MGDVIHNLPVVNDILAARPGAEIDWVVEESFAGLPKLHPGVRRVLPVAIRRWRSSWWQAPVRSEIRAFVAELKKWPYGAVVDTQGLLKRGCSKARSWPAAPAARASASTGRARASRLPFATSVLFGFTGTLARLSATVRRPRRLLSTHYRGSATMESPRPAGSTSGYRLGPMRSSFT